MKLLKFEKLNQLIVVAAQGDKQIILDKFRVEENSLSINFIEYVKSQLHVNVVSDLFDRDIFCYLNAYKFLKGDYLLEGEALKVLHYFYEDIANFLINNPINVRVDLQINSTLDSSLQFPHSASTFYDFSEIKDFFINLIEEKDEELLYKIIETSKYSFILDMIQSLDDLQNKFDSYVLATALLTQLKEGITGENLVEFPIDGGNYGINS